MILHVRASLWAASSIEVVDETEILPTGNEDSEHLNRGLAKRGTPLFYVVLLGISLFGERPYLNIRYLDNEYSLYDICDRQLEKGVQLQTPLCLNSERPHT